MFPFLAVLICTIGSLVVLLVVITRQARLQAARAAAETVDQTQRDVQAQMEMAEWRIEQLRESRRKTAEQVSDLRNTVGHLEDHARKLETELQQLKHTWEALEQTAGVSQQDKLETELAQTLTDIQTAEEALVIAEQRAAERPPSFAVIPHQGPNQTRRRPMYIECQEDQIVLQPEAIALQPDDFDGPDGPGNPLAAALRAKREYLLTYGNLDPREAGEPYPLLIVRPSGIGAYYAARNAMNSWGSEFGYELVEADWHVEYLDTDPQLAELLRQTIETTRVRQEQLAAAAPRHYGSQRSQVMYRAAPGGGITVDSASSEPVRPGPAYGSSSATAPGRSKTAVGKDRENTSGAPASQTAGEPPIADAGTPADAKGFASSDRPSPIGTRTPGNHDGTASRSAFASQAPSGSAEAGSNINPSDLAGASAAGPRDRQPAPGGEGTPLKLGEWRDPQTLRPLADEKGRNWALPNAGHGATPITRPVRLECYPDRLLLPVPAGAAGTRTIQLGADMAESMDELAAAVWDVIDGWGIAGRDLYWSPVLEVRVAPGAESRYRDLELLLKGSGLTLEQQ